MRILLLDANIRYTNPTRTLLPGVLAQLGDLVCYGPGYVSIDILRDGLYKFMERRGPFDVLIATEQVTFPHPLPRDQLYNIYRRNYLTPFPSDALVYRDEINEMFCDFNGMKLASLMQTDYYTGKMNSIRSVEESAAYFLTWGQEFFRSVKGKEISSQEKFLQLANDNWANCFARNAKRVISFPHFVCESESAWTPIRDRSVEWSVVGANYHARALIRKSLSSARIPWNGRRLAVVSAGLRRLKINPDNKSLGITLLNHFFREAIAGSRYSFTCGSALRYPLRKFFEIPALGAVLVCEPCAGFEALGFRDGENAIACAPEDILDVHRDLEADPGRAQAIADAGRAMVLGAHTVAARARQLGRCLEAIRSGTFAGSKWENGDLVVLTRASAATESTAPAPTRIAT